MSQQVKTLDPHTLKTRFPLLREHPEIVYLDNAATTHKPDSVLASMTDFYTHHNGNIGRGNHRLTREATEMYEAVREKVAKFIHAQSKHEIVFTRNTTEGINVLAFGLEQSLSEGDEILLTQQEHHSNLLPWIALATRTGASVKYLPVKQNGEIDHTIVDTFVSDKTKIFSFSLISNVLGTIAPARLLIEKAKQLNPEIVTIIDAAQAVGHIPVNIDHLQCDFLVFSGHKMYGPMGVGILWGRKKLLQNLPPFLLGGGMVSETTYGSFIPKRAPSRFEAGTPDVAAVVGLQAAITLLEKVSLPSVAEHERVQSEKLVAGLQEAFIESITFYGWPQQEKTEHIGIVSFSIADIHAEELANYLDADNIMVRAGHHCTKPFHDEVLGCESTLRISLGMYNTNEEIQAAIESLKKSIQILR